MVIVEPLNRIAHNLATHLLLFAIIVLHGFGDPKVKGWDPPVDQYCPKVSSIIWMTPYNQRYGNQIFSEDIKINF